MNIDEIKKILTTTGSEFSAVRGNQRKTARALLLAIKALEEIKRDCEERDISAITARSALRKIEEVFK